MKKLINEFPEEKYNIYISSKKFADNWFSHEDRQFSIISINDWEQTFAPPSLKTYIIYQIAQSLLGFETEISEEMLLKIVHEPSRGCMFDFCSEKHDIKLGMVSGIICPECKATLIRYGIKVSAIEAVEKILEYVRAEAIGMPILVESDLAFIVMRFTNND